jgi:hypothetical protein
LASAILIRDFGSGKKTVKGKPNPDHHVFPEVVAVAPAAVDRILGVSTVGERTRVLRELKREDLLVAPSRHRLQSRVRGGEPPLPPEKIRAYVFAVPSVEHVSRAAYEARRRLGLTSGSRLIRQR